ncbi:MAG: YiiX/YebB-like N1pC/P60 family cysteine hydrolase [Candidatus Binataceae bacterium]
MAWTETYNPLTWLRQKIADVAIAILTKPVKSYDLHAPNDPANLRRHIRKGDVILVEGNERISQCIKYLTQSSWSHSALYVGDEPLSRNPQLREEYVEQFGEDAGCLLVEALVQSGTVLSPLSKYRDFNIRVCRPYNLSAQDLGAVLDEAIAAVGDQYDIKNAVDLARYFLPLSLIPARFRRRALHFGSGVPTRVICSSLIASCFMKVKFPIVPRYEQLPDGTATPLRQRRLWPMARRQGTAPPGLFHPVPAWLVTPRDFDLSPYFEIVKFNIIENMRFDYHKILWAEDLEPEQIKKGA